MDACLSCFGRKTQRQDACAHDQDPLLPESINSGHFQHERDLQVRSKKIAKGKKNGRIVDFDGNAVVGDMGAEETPSRPGDGLFRANATPRPPLLGRLVDIVAAVKAGKLPSQDQVSRLLQVALSSDLLREDEPSGLRDAEKFHGSGPASRRGRKVLTSLRNVLQAVLEFGLEKNDDNKIQELFCDLGGIAVSDMGAGLDLDSRSQSFHREKEVSEPVFNTGKESVKDKAGLSEMAEDAAILLHALRTLLQSALTSTVFRLLLKELVSILRDLAAHGAADVGSVAFRVHAAAKEVERNLNEADVGEKEVQVIEGVVKPPSPSQLKGKAKGVADWALESAKGTTSQVSDKAGEYRAEAMDRFRDDLIARLQQVLVRAQEDPASRSAIRAILILTREYVDKVADSGDVAVEAAEQIVSEGISAAEEVVSFKSPSSKKENSKPPSSYPPPATLYPPLSREGDASGPNTSDDISPLKATLLDLKVLLERVARGHLLDGVLRALVDVAQDLRELPIEVSETVANEVDARNKGKAKDEGAGTSHSRKGKGKDKKKKGKKGGGGSTSDKVFHDPMANGDTGGTTTPIPYSMFNLSMLGSSNALRAYFSRIGDCLDHALDEPGWVMSRKGTKELELLFNDGVDVLNVVGEVAIDVGSTGVEAGLESGDHPESKNEGSFDNISNSSEQHALEIRRQFRSHIRSLMEELDGYVSSVEKDRTTMKLLRSLDGLSRSTSDLLSTDFKSRARKVSGAFASRIRSSLRWTEWVAWAVPRLLKFVPVNAIPIPSLEARSESGSWEAGLYALFVQGEATEAGVGSARQGRRGQKKSVEPISGGIQTTLMPDEVLLKEWTEVRIDMSDEDSMGPSSGRSITKTPLRDDLRGRSPQIDTTSRIQMHVDGIRAKVDGLGYYFKYGQAWFGYEDEGIMNVDIGMGDPHAGLGCDVEVEVTSEHTPRTRPSFHKHGQPLDRLPPRIGVGEGIEGEGDLATVSEYVASPPGNVTPSASDTAVVVEGETHDSDGGIEVEINEGPPNLDIQMVVNASAVNWEREQAASQSTVFPYSATGHHDTALEPLFKVVHVNVQMEGVKVVLEQSRHWILNKLLVQPLAGPVVHGLVKNGLEMRIRESLESCAMELGRLSRDVAEQGEIRREKSRRRLQAERESRMQRLMRQSNADEVAFEDLFGQLEDGEGGISEWVEDWVNAIALRSAKACEDEVREEEDVRTRTVDAMKRGLVYYSSTANVEVEPDSNPPMFFNKHTQRMEPVKEEMRRSSDREVETDRSDITVAVGGGSQLFRDKEVPYGRRHDAGGEEGEGLLEEATGKAKNLANDAMGLKGQVAARFNKDIRKERGSGWRSSAFDI